MAATNQNSTTRDFRKLKLGFLGLGQATSKLLSRRAEIESLPYLISAAADLRPHALQSFAREFGGKVFDNAEDLCRDPGLDVIYIATPAEFHREHVEIAARHGCPSSNDLEQPR